MFATEDEDEYDQAGCLTWLNKFFEYHNELLQIELNRLSLVSTNLQNILVVVCPLTLLAFYVTTIR